MPTSNGSKRAAAETNGHANGTLAETPFEMWQRTNVVRQKQEGYVAAVTKLFMGDLTAEQMLHLADLAERYSNGNIRTTINQNMIIRWIPESRVADLYADLASQGLADPGAELVEDIIACPGTDTCGLGITSSKGLARALAEVFPAGRVPEDLKMSTLRSAGATTPVPSTISPRSACMEWGSVLATTLRPSMNCIWAAGSMGRPRLDR